VDGRCRVNSRLCSDRRSDRLDCVGRSGLAAARQAVRGARCAHAAIQGRRLTTRWLADKLVEVGLIGCEGMSGTSVVLGGHSSPHLTYLQVAGDGQHIAADSLCKVLEASRTLHVMLLKYVQAFMVQTAHTAIANAQANVEQRLARWILMAHDRVSGDVLLLTHEFLSLMLAVRRAGVTEALQNLSKRRLIKTGRGEIVVLNRRGIERAAGALYGVPEAEYRRLI
jgi:Crp-like helix-turn-helix domain